MSKGREPHLGRALPAQDEAGGISNHARGKGALLAARETQSSLRVSLSAEVAWGAAQRREHGATEELDAVLGTNRN